MAVVRSRASRRARETKRYGNEQRALGLRIRSLRNAKKLTIEQAAEVIEMDPTHLTKIEGGTINLTFATLVRIASGLRIGLPDLFSGG